MAAFEALQRSQIAVGLAADLLFGQVGQWDEGDATVGEDEGVAAPLADVYDGDRVVLDAGQQGIERWGFEERFGVREQLLWGQGADLVDELLKGARGTHARLDCLGGSQDGGGLGGGGLFQGGAAVEQLLG